MRWKLAGEEADDGRSQRGRGVDVRPQGGRVCAEKGGVGSVGDEQPLFVAPL